MVLKLVALKEEHPSCPLSLPLFLDGGACCWDLGKGAKMKSTIRPMAQMAWTHLFTILHINDGLSRGAFFRIIHTDYLLPVTLVRLH